MQNISPLDPVDEVPYLLRSSHTPYREPEPGLEGSMELTLDEVLAPIQRYGFKIEEWKTINTGYIEDDLRMMKYNYEAEYWVAIKS